MTLLAISAINFYPQEHQSLIHITKIILLFMNIIYTLNKDINICYQSCEYNIYNNVGSVYAELVR